MFWSYFGVSRPPLPLATFVCVAWDGGVMTSRERRGSTSRAVEECEATFSAFFPARPWTTRRRFLGRPAARSTSCCPGTAGECGRGGGGLPSAGLGPNLARRGVARLGSARREQTFGKWRRPALGDRARRRRRGRCPPADRGSGPWLTLCPTHFSPPSAAFVATCGPPSTCQLG